MVESPKKVMSRRIVSSQPKLWAAAKLGCTLKFNLLNDKDITHELTEDGMNDSKKKLETFNTF